MLDIHNGKDHWRVVKIGIEKREPGEYTSPSPYQTYDYVEQWRRRFAAFKELPKLTQEAVSLLSMCEHHGAIAGIGQKVSPDTFWVDDTPELLAEYEEEKSDSRSKSKKESKSTA